MVEIFKDNKLIPVMPGTQCRGCRENINLGIPKFRLDNDTLAVYCKRCYWDREICGIRFY